MKKFIIVVGLLLVAAVFMSGCVTETEDPIVGVWNNYASETVMVGVGVASTSMVFNADGTGFSLTDFTGELAYAELDFTWKKEGDGKYIIERPDYWYDVGIMPQYDEKLTLDGDKLSVIAGEYVTEFRRQPVAEYVLGLWTPGVISSADTEEFVVLMYISKDGTGNVIGYGPEVMGIDDVYTFKITWEEKDGKISAVDETGNAVDFILKNGALYNDANEEFHKYAVEDRLLGIWMSDEPSKEAEGTFDIVILLRPDGPGVEIWTLPGSHVASAKYYFEWEMTGPTTYQAVYDDGEIWDFATEFTKLTDGETTYSKVGYDVLAEYAQKVTA